MTNTAENPADELADLAQRLQVSEDKRRDLELALISNRRIGIALGILMERLRVSEQEAWTHLVTTSQQSNVKLRELAEELVYTGELEHPQATD